MCNSSHHYKLKRHHEQARHDGPQVLMANSIGIEAALASPNTVNVQPAPTESSIGCRTPTPRAPARQRVRLAATLARPVSPGWRSTLRVRNVYNGRDPRGQSHYLSRMLELCQEPDEPWGTCQGAWRSCGGRMVQMLLVRAWANL